MELKEGVGRIDERTVAIHDNQKRLGRAFVGHEAKDREDFKEVHTRITTVEKKQNWTLGVGSAIVFAITIAASYLGSIPAQPPEPTKVTLDLDDIHSEVSTDGMEGYQGD